MILLCDVNIELLEEDLKDWSRLRRDKWAEFVSSGRKADSARHKELQEQYDRMAEQIAITLDMLTFQCMHSGTGPDPVREKAFARCNLWRSLLPKTENASSTGHSFHHFAGVLDAQNRYGTKPHEPQTYHDWLAEADLSNVPSHSRDSILRNLPPEIVDWPDMYNLLPLHKGRIKSAEAIKSAYDKAVATGEMAAPVSDETSEPSRLDVPSDYPMTPWENFLTEEGLAGWSSYLHGNESIHHQLRDIIARKRWECSNIDDSEEEKALTLQIEDIVRFPMSMPMQWQDEHHSPQQAKEFEAAGMGGITSYRLCVHCGRNDILDDDKVVEKHLSECPQNPDNYVVEIEEDIDEFVAEVLEWQNDKRHRKHRSHVYRWERVLQALVPLYASNHPTLLKKGSVAINPMTLAEVKEKACRFNNERWSKTLKQFIDRGIE